MIPLCLGRSGAERTISIPRSASLASEVQTFCPLTIHSSPSSSARVLRPARSEPAPGSLNSWHQDRWPVTMSRTSVPTCSGVPWSAMVGAANMMPSPSGAPNAPNAAISRAIWMPTLRATPRPYASTARVGAAHPAVPKSSHHAATVRSGSQCRPSQSRRSASTSASSVAVSDGSVMVTRSLRASAAAVAHSVTSPCRLRATESPCNRFERASVRLASPASSVTLIMARTREFRRCRG